MEHVMTINKPLALLVSFYSGYEGEGKVISIHEYVLATVFDIGCMLHLKHKYRIVHIDATIRALYIQRFNGYPHSSHPHLVTSHLLKVRVAASRGY